MAASSSAFKSHILAAFLSGVAITAAAPAWAQSQTSQASDPLQELEAPQVDVTTREPGQGEQAKTKKAAKRKTVTRKKVRAAEPPAETVAQDTPPDTDQNQASATSETTAGLVIGYQAVTSDAVTRFRTPLRKLPQSVTVIPKSLLQDQGSLGVSEALGNAAAASGNASLSTPSFDASIVRGFDAETWIDGKSTYYNGGDRESLVNIERIEVLKGPSALFSAGGVGSPIGGAISLVTKLPTEDRFATAGVTIGSGLLLRPFFDINQPLSDAALFRMTGEYTRRDYSIDSIQQDSYNLNPTLVLQGADTRLTLSRLLKKSLAAAFPS